MTVIECFCVVLSEPLKKWQQARCFLNQRSLQWFGHCVVGFVVGGYIVGDRLVAILMVMRARGAAYMPDGSGSLNKNTLHWRHCRLCLIGWRLYNIVFIDKCWRDAGCCRGVHNPSRGLIDCKVLL
ncbi:hypothetical protein [Endozoicomonas sp. SCSIO W0465]|uniref:hypothetical protein n=1 Tax=Endozoicomonas sp. SCSIO W0465 TaxID=2918516 RepID=UPI0020751C5A|nr:hypothetical protein [Endozoicomonas sp. SCSIO W0465]USE34378.1 hypothetical protein MJO57_19775 [Endozoicomonas sp. SCSIO W0465]